MERQDQIERPDSVPGTGSASAYPEDVARVLSSLAHLIDDSITVRGSSSGPRELAARHLGAPASGIVVTTRELGTVAFQLVALSFARDLHTYEPDPLTGEDPADPPRWERLELGEEKVTVPFTVTACFAPGTIAAGPLVVQLAERYDDDGFVVRVWSRTGDAEAASAWLDALVDRARRGPGPFRNRLLRAYRHRAFGLCFKVLPSVAESREDLVLRTDVWNEVDRSVHGLFASLDRLRDAGLACNRGLLLAGKPGTGKSALCRVVASELTGRVTVVFCDASAVSYEVDTLYRELEHLAPALVVMEDIDLVVGHRGSGSEALVRFLGAMDGVMSHHAGVVTMATTNDPKAIDEAARRAGRFDAVVAVDPPDRTAREAILRRYLRSLDVAVDAGRVAAATGGATGAMLRELVTRAVLVASSGDGGVTTELLLALAAEAAPPPAPGQYL